MLKIINMKNNLHIFILVGAEKSSFIKKVGENTSSDKTRMTMEILFLACQADTNS